MVELCAGTCLFLAADPKSREMRGRYLDVEHVEAVCENAEEIRERGGHDLKLELTGGWIPAIPMTKPLQSKEKK